MQEVDDFSSWDDQGGITIGTSEPDPSHEPMPGDIVDTRTDAMIEQQAASAAALASVADQALGSSPLSGEYQNYADQLAALDYGLSTDPDQLTWDNKHGKYDYSDSPLFAKAGEGMNPAFDRGSIGNFFAGPEGFNKYRGPMAEGLDQHGGFWESFLEGLINVLTLGMVDPEFSGREASAYF